MAEADALRTQTCVEKTWMYQTDTLMRAVLVERPVLVLEEQWR